MQRIVRNFKTNTNFQRQKFYGTKVEIFYFFQFINKFLGQSQDKFNAEHSSNRNIIVRGPVKTILSFPCGPATAAFTMWQIFIVISTPKISNAAFFREARTKRNHLIRSSQDVKWNNSYLGSQKTNFHGCT